MLVPTEQDQRCAVFVSYYHRADQDYYAAFRRHFVDELGLVRDCSLQAPVPGKDSRQIMGRIRAQHLARASCLLVLCGPQTRGRKWVDWEIRAALQEGQGLIGIGLPDLPVQCDRDADIPDRLRDNIAAGYALWTTWAELCAEPGRLRQQLAQAQSCPQDMIRNQRPMRRRNEEELGWLGRSQVCGT